MWYLFAFHLHCHRHEQSWDSCVTRCTCVHSRIARKISRRSIGIVRARGFCNNVPIANLKDRCIQSNQQQHRDNVPAQTTSDYYQRAVAIPFLDHLQSEMKIYFNPTNDTVLSSLFNLLPEMVAVGDRNPDIEG